MAVRREVRVSCRAALLALLVCVLCTSVSAVLVDLGSYSVQDPRITVNYTEDVFLLSASLVNLDPGASIGEYALRQVPPKDPAQPTYLTSYRLYTGTQDEPQYLVSGRYQLTLEALDREGRPTLDIVEFTITGLDIVMQNPRFGFSPTFPFDVTLGTSIGGDAAFASCWYSKTGWTSGQARIEAVGEYDQEHVISGLSYNGYLYVSCTESTGRETRQRFTIGRDATAPTINASAIPRVVSDPRDKSAIVRALTDDNSSCSIDGSSFPQEDPRRAETYRRVHEARVYFDTITDTAQHDITKAVSCSNLVGLSADASVPITVDFGAFIGINVLDPPTGYVNATSFTLRIRPTFDATTCSVNHQPMQAQADEVWLSLFTGISNAHIALNMTCSGAGKNASLEHNITIDTSPPIVTALTPTNAICAGRSPSTSAQWNMSDAFGIASARYEVRQGVRNLSDGTTVLSRATAPLPAGLNGTLTWYVWATDLAGNTGAATSTAIACGQNATSPSGGNYDQGGPCIDDADCLSGRSCVEGVCFVATDVGNSCVDDVDCAVGETCVDGMCANEAGDGACMNRRLDAGEESVDCGGACPPCVTCFDDSECGIDQRCGTEGVCIPRPAGGLAACISDIDCPFGQACDAGSCVARDGGPVTPPTAPVPGDDEGSSEANWLAISLLIAGSLLMAGAGWFLYDHDRRKKKTQALSRSFAVSPRSPADANVLQDALSAQRAPTVRQPLNRPSAPRSAAQRKEILGAFSATGGAQQQQKSTAVKSATKPAGKPVTEGKDDDDGEVFDELDSLGKKRHA